MNELKQWYNERGRKILIVLAGILGVYLFFKYLLSYTAPFIIAWIIASGLQKIVRWLNEKLHMKRGIATMLAMVTVLSAISWGITALVRQIFTQANNLYQKIPLYRHEIMEVINNISAKTQNLFSILSFNSPITLENTIDQLFQGMASFLGPFLSKGSINVVSKVPNILFLTIITLLSIFFMTRDYIKIQRFVHAQIPSSMIEKMDVLKEDLVSALGGYVRTQLILMCVTIGICFIGFLLLGINNAILISIIIGAVDALPIFGSGLFLIPWSLYNLVLGHYSMALGLGAMYGLITVVRQTMEPRVLSSQIGVYTLVTLMGMYIGFKILGVIGLIIGPIVVIIFKTFQKAGILPPFKEIEE